MNSTKTAAKNIDRFTLIPETVRDLDVDSSTGQNVKGGPGTATRTTGKPH